MQWRVDPTTRECCSTCTHFVHYLSRCKSSLPKNAPDSSGRYTEYDFSPCSAWEKGFRYEPTKNMGLGGYVRVALAPEVG